MPEETQWIDWHPKVGDARPPVYRWKMPADKDWEQGLHPGHRVCEIESDSGQQFQIPAPVVTPPADRPPWIDPQCKFRWGDRVKDKGGNVWFVNHPHDGDDRFPVTCTKTRHYASPYEAANLKCWHTDDNIDVFDEGDLELYPEDLPQHFDDRLLDADGPQGARIPREIWINLWKQGPIEELGCIFYSSEEARKNSSLPNYIRTIHFREVL